MTSQVCVDASVALKLFLDEEDSDLANALWASWVETDIQIIGPHHLAYEVVSVIRNHVYRDNIDAEAGRLAMEAFQAQEVMLLHPDTLIERAWRLAHRFNRPTVYDAYYLALSELVGCDLWTSDRRLYHAVRDDLSQVKWLGDFVPNSGDP